MSALKTLTGTAFLAAPTVTLGVTGERYLGKGMNDTEDIRNELEFDVSKTEERNKEVRKIEETVKEIKIVAYGSGNMIVNEVNALKVEVWGKFKNTDADKKAKKEVIEKKDVYDDKLVKDMFEKAQAYDIVHGKTSYGYGFI